MNVKEAVTESSIRCWLAVRDFLRGVCWDVCLSVEGGRGRSVGTAAASLGSAVGQQEVAAERAAGAAGEQGEDHQTRQSVSGQEWYERQSERGDVQVTGASQSQETGPPE